MDETMTTQPTMAVLKNVVDRQVEGVGARARRG
jgi:hypothetical protein